MYIAITVTRVQKFGYQYYANMCCVSQSPVGNKQALCALNITVSFIFNGDLSFVVTCSYMPCV